MVLKGKTLFNSIFFRRLSNNSRRLLFAIVFSFVALPASLVLADSQSCKFLFAQAPYSAAEHEAMKTQLSNNSFALTDKPTVFFVETLPNDLIVIKHVGGEWFSSYNFYKNAVAPQSDPRLLPHVLGARLSLLMGIRFEARGDGIYMLVPNAERLGRLVRAVNRVLTKAGLETISYLPIRTGLITNKDALALALKPDKDIVLHFPFADGDPRLVVHEISAHLSALLLPKKFLKRGQDLTKRTQELIEFLRKKESVLGSVTSKLIEQLERERAYEIDAGTANLTANMGLIRGASNDVPYTDLLGDILAQSAIKNAVDMYARPNLSPLTSVLTRTEILAGISDPSPDFYIEKRPRVKVGETVKLSEVEKRNLKEILNEFSKNKSREEKAIGHEVAQTENWIVEIVLGLDKRIEQIEAAISSPNLWENP